MFTPLGFHALVSGSTPVFEKLCGRILKFRITPERDASIQTVALTRLMGAQVPKERGGFLPLSFRPKLPTVFKDML